MTDVWTAAIARWRHLADRYDTVVAQFSGGKDSTALLAVALAAHDGADVLAEHHDLETNWPTTRAHTDRIAAHPRIVLRRTALPMLVVHWLDAAEPAMWPFDPDAADLWVADPHPDAIRSVPGWSHRDPWDRHYADMCALLWPADDHGAVVHVTGLRSDESPSRRTMARRGSWLTRTPAGRPDLAHPILDWSDLDVWRAHLEAPELGHNACYDVQHRSGVNRRHTRCSNGPNRAWAAAWSTWLADWPAWQHRVAARLPAVTGLRDEWDRLWGVGGPRSIADALGGDHEAVDWPQAIADAVARVHPRLRSHIADRVRTFVSQHQRQTVDAIPPIDPHPLTGVSWAWLMQVALGGDVHLSMRPIRDADTLDRLADERRMHLGRNPGWIASGRIGSHQAPRPVAKRKQTANA